MTGIPMGLEVFQNAYVVPDLNAALEHWTGNLGVGPFFVYEHMDLGATTYRGAPSALDASLALTAAGNVQVELIEQHSDTPSAYRDLFPKGSSGGFHHVGVWVDDFDVAVAHYQALGYPLTSAGAPPAIGARFAYMDASKDLGIMVELVERSKTINDFIDMLKGAAKDWDGSDPIRHSEF